MVDDNINLVLLDIGNDRGAAPEKRSRAKEMDQGSADFHLSHLLISRLNLPTVLMMSSEKLSISVKRVGTLIVPFFMMFSEAIMSLSAFCRIGATLLIPGFD